VLLEEFLHQTLKPSPANAAVNEAIREVLNMAGRRLAARNGPRAQRAPISFSIDRG